MTEINRQKFMVELTQLLSFMYEEDRQYALEMYERMFDIAEDQEQELIQHLMSPTRQAVIIARAYNSKARSLTVSTRSRDEDDVEEEEGTPAFVLAINRIFDDLFPEEAAEEQPQEDQVSFFDLGVADDAAAGKKTKMPRAATLLSDTQEFDAITFPTDGAADEEPEEENPDPAEEENLAEEEAPAEKAGENSPEEKNPEQESFEQLTEDEQHAEQPEPEEDPVGRADEIIAAFLAQNEPEKTESAADSGEMPDDETVMPQETVEPEKNSGQKDIQEEQPTESDAAETEEHAAPVPPEEKAPAAEQSAPTPVPTIEEPEEESDRENPDAETKASVPLLIAFLIVAIPATLAILAALAIITAACLGTAVGLTALGAVLVVAAFSGFAVLADILLLLGAAIVVLALGLLMLWLGLWLIGGVMVGLVRSVHELCRKWCWKEVPAA